MIFAMRNRTLAALVTLHMMLLATSPAAAALMPSALSSGKASGEILQRDLGTIRNALETRIVQEKLNAAGLTEDEAVERISSMTPDQIHLLARASGGVLAGGDAGTAILVLGIIMTAFALYTLINFILGSSPK